MRRDLVVRVDEHEGDGFEGKAASVTVYLHGGSRVNIRLDDTDERVLHINATARAGAPGLAVRPTGGINALSLAVED